MNRSNGRNPEDDAKHDVADEEVGSPASAAAVQSDAFAAAVESGGFGSPQTCSDNDNGGNRGATDDECELSADTRDDDEMDDPLQFSAISVERRSSIRRDADAADAGGGGPRSQRSSWSESPVNTRRRPTPSSGGDAGDDEAVDENCAPPSPERQLGAGAGGDEDMGTDEGADALRDTVSPADHVARGHGGKTV